MLIFALLGAIVNLPCFYILKEKPVMLIVIWRYIGVLYIAFPKLIIDLYTQYRNYDMLEFIKNNYLLISCTAFALTMSQFFIYKAALLTYFAHTLLLSGISGCFIVFWKIASKQGYTKIEYIGLGINVFGAYLCCCDANSLPSIFWKFNCEKEKIF